MGELRDNYNYYMLIKKRKFLHENASDVKSIFNKVLEAAEEGFKDAYFEVGEAYNKGLKAWGSNDYAIAPNEKEAIKWYEEGAKVGDMKSYLALVNAYGNGIVKTCYTFEAIAIKSNLKEAIKWLEKVCELGDNSRLIALASAYFVDNNPKKGEETLQKGVELNIVNCLCDYAKRLKNGDNVTKDLKKSFECYTKASELNENTSLYELALFYKDGLYVAQDHNKAIELFESSDTKQGYFEIANYYEKGVFVKRDYKKAIEYYYKSRDCYDGKDNRAYDRLSEIAYNEDIDKELLDEYITYGNIHFPVK